MDGALLGGVVAMGLGLLLAPVVRGVGWRLGVLDHPGPLSIHATPVPRTGGLGVVLSMTGGVLIAGPLLDGPALGLLLAVLGCAGLVYLIGLADDASGLAPWLKILLPAGAALLAFLFGIRLGTFPLPASLPLTLLVLVGAANAVNLLDGMDGLAAGVGVIAALFLGGLAWLQGDAGALLLAGCLAGACGGFLPFNIRRASLFLGDGGSLVIGFTLGVLAIMLSAELGALRGSLGAGLVLGLPALDFGLAVVRRLRRGQSIFAGDREHIYDLPQRQGMGAGKVVLLMYAVAILFGVSGLVVVTVPLGVGVALGSVEVIAFGVVAWRLGVRVLAREEGG